jgi:hypothetical protein
VIQPHVLKAIDGVDITPVYEAPIILNNPKHWDMIFKGMFEVAKVPAVPPIKPSRTQAIPLQVKQELRKLSA